MKFLQNRAVQLSIIIFFTFLAYANILGNKLVWDDHLFLQGWPEIKSIKNLPALLSGSAPSEQGKIYRPLRSIFYLVDYNFFGANPFWYHLQAIFIHLSATIFVYLIIELMLKQGALFSNNQESTVSSKHGLSGSWRFLPFTAALLFGLHPIHTETIDYISASLETWGTLFFFASFYFYLLGEVSITKSNNFFSLFIKNKNLLISLILALTAFFTYEMTLTLPLLIIFYDFCRGRLNLTKKSLKKTYLKYLPYFIAVFIFIFLRVIVFNITTRTDYLGYSFFLTMLVMVKVFARYIFLLFIPINLTTNHNLVGNFPSSMLPYDSLNPILGQSIFDLDTLFAVFILAFLIYLSVYCFKKYPLISFCIGWFFISLLPVSYLIPHGGAMAEKFLYIPSFAFVLSLVYIAVIFFKKSKSGFEILKKVFFFLFLVLAVNYFFLTTERNKIWYNDISLFKDMLSKSPDNLLANYTLGVRYVEAGDYSRAIKRYSAAISKAPEFWEARLNLANIYFAQDKKKLARAEYEKVLSLKPSLDFVKTRLSQLEATAEAKIKKSPVQAKKFGLNELLSPILANLPVLTVFDNPGHLFSFSFLVPDNWLKQAKDGEIMVADPQGIFNLLFAQDFRSDNLSIQKYLALHQESYGSLQNQGLAQIPNFDTSYVKIFNDNGIQKDQFFLFKDNNVIQILVYPADSPLMREFDKIVQSIQVKNSK